MLELDVLQICQEEMLVLVLLPTYWEKILELDQLPTLIFESPIHSLTLNITISSKAIRMYCNGENFPRTAPNEISTAAAAKSAVNILEGENVIFRIGLAH